MTASSKRSLLSLLVIGSGICLPCSCVTAIFTCTIVNPMAISFKHCFHVTNGLDESIDVTPIGVFEHGTTRHPLPLLLDVPGYVTAFGRREYRIASGETCRICYDNDDAMLTELVIEGDGWSRMFDVSKVPDPDFTKWPVRWEYVIDDEAELVAVSPGAAAALLEPHREYFALVLVILGIAAPIVFWRSRRALRRMKAPGENQGSDWAAEEAG